MNKINKELVNKFFKDNRLFAAIMIIEFAVIIMCTLLAILVPKQVLNYTADDILLPDSDKHIYDKNDGVLSLIENDQNGEMVIYYSEEKSILPGAYETTVDYSTCFDKNSIHNYAVRISYCSGIKGNVVALNSAYDSITSRFWTNNITGEDNFYFALVFSGEATTDIFSIGIEEIVPYRYIKIIGLLLLFALLDVIWFLLFSKTEIKQYNTNYITLFIIVFIASLPYLSELFNFAHDTAFHLMRIQSVANNLASGQFPVRMMYDMCNGFGYPNSVFYCDIFLYLPALLFNMGVAVKTCFKIYYILITAFTAIVTYICANKIVKDEKISLIAAAIYVLGSYRIVCAFTRTAVGEYTAIAFLPLVVLGIYNIYTKQEPCFEDWFPLSLGITGILLSHILSTEITGIALIVFVCFNLRKTLKIKRMVAIIKAAVMTLIMSCWFIIPFIDYYLSHSMSVSQISNDICATGLYPLQLFYIFNYAGGANLDNGIRNEMSLSLGLPLLILVVAVVYCCLNRRKWSIDDTTGFKAIKSFTIMFVIILFMSSYLFPWNYIQKLGGEFIGMLLGSIQFLWRYLSIASVLICFGGIIALKFIKQYELNKFNTIVMIIVCSLVINVGFYYYTYGNSADTRTFYEYSTGGIEVGYGEYYLSGTDGELLYDNSVIVSAGEADIASYNNINGIRNLVVNNTGEEGATIEIPVFAYKYYQTTDLETNNLISITKGSNNRISIALPPNYSGTVQTEFKSPLHWRIAEFVSLISYILILVFIKRKRVK